MHIENKQLLDFLEEIDKELDFRIELIAVGGTAMTLLNLKPSTIDVDFDLSFEHKKLFQSALKKIPHGFKLDLFSNGLIFSQQLPEDYKKKIIPIKAKFKNIELFALHPLDIVVSKIGRLNERDEEDIRDCIKKFKITKNQVMKRAKQVDYIGREQNYQINLKFALKEFF
ncbi:MAG: DUF6036 family nucleotidyltransferase [archaeon]|nr:DUF6036 family nucleotidyltransferase [archaeon]